MEIIYKSFDNKVFSSEEVCKLYEQVEVSKDVIKEINLDSANNILKLKFRNLKCHILDCPNLYTHKKLGVVRKSNLNRFTGDNYLLVKSSYDCYIVFEKILNIALLKLILKKLQELTDLNMTMVKNIKYLDIYAKSNYIVEMFKNEN